MALDKEIKKSLIADFGINEKDTGSAQVQVGILSEDIRRLTGHLQENKHDFSSKRGLLKKVARRRKLLDYIKSKDTNKYYDIVSRLGLKK